MTSISGTLGDAVATARPKVPVAAVLEAKLVGVGLLGPIGQILLTVAPPMGLVIDGWTWMMRDKTHRRMLRQRSG